MVTERWEESTGVGLYIKSLPPELVEISEREMRSRDHLSLSRRCRGGERSRKGLNLYHRSLSLHDTPGLPTPLRFIRTGRLRWSENWLLRSRRRSPVSCKPRPSPLPSGTKPTSNTLLNPYLPVDWLPSISPSSTGPHHHQRRRMATSPIGLNGPRRLNSRYRS